MFDNAAQLYSVAEINQRSKQQTTDDAPREQTRIAVSFVTLALAKYRMSTTLMNIGELTPWITSQYWTRTADNRLPPNVVEFDGPANGKLHHEFPGEICRIIEAELNDKFGNPGFRVLKALTNLNSIDRLQEIQEVMLPLELFYDDHGKYAADGMHRRVHAHLDAVEEKYGAQNMYSQLCEPIRESLDAAREWKENVLRDVSTEILAGNGMIHELSPLHDQWKREIDAVLDTRILKRGELPTDKQRAQQAPQAQQPFVINLDPATIAAQVNAQVEARVADALAAQKVTFEAMMAEIMAQKGLSFKEVPMLPEPVAAELSEDDVDALADLPLAVSEEGPQTATTEERRGGFGMGSRKGK